MSALFTLFFDLTANGGWNLIAMVTWASIIGIPAFGIYERVFCGVGK